MVLVWVDVFVLHLVFIICLTLCFVIYKGKLEKNHTYQSLLELWLSWAQLLHAPQRNFESLLLQHRSCRIFSIANKNCILNISKTTPAHTHIENGDAKPKPVRIFHDDTLRSFFRRLAFSPDGQLLIAPAGCIEDADKTVNASFIFTRGAFSK